MKKIKPILPKGLNVDNMNNLDWSGLGMIREFAIHKLKEWKKNNKKEVIEQKEEIYKQIAALKSQIAVLDQIVPDPPTTPKKKYIKNEYDPSEGGKKLW